ncbi:uncharacterized protein RHO25_003321 [Cercospora beticola]|uniref:Rhodopsin domain-containing protein n=2 Tax=Cercospora beticola TaxID=122368 RepID=A0ABZ0NGP8_CERBT|nr:hypothetical protein RHO25_003321 [Cercospora beticola]CAK1359977.1 unnamed protein product [Cercospora beticola]
MPGNIINLSLADVVKWPKANYVNPHRRKWMPGYASFLYALATTSVLIRALSRIQKARHNGTRSTTLLGLDDMILVIGWGTLTWFTTLNILGAEKYQTSRHMWDVEPSIYSPMAKITWLAEFSFLVCGACVKVSVLLFYRRLGSGTYSRVWSWACIGAIIFTLAWTLAFILALIFNCSPTEAYWMGFSIKYTKKFSCVDTTVNNLLAGIMAVISDLYAVALPCFLMRKIQLPKAQKIGLYAVFSAGLLVVAAGSVRTYYLYQVGHSSDVSSIIFDVFVWSQLELCMGFMCASAPSLRMFGRRYFRGPYNRLRKHLGACGGRKPQRKGENSGAVELSIRKIDCPYEQVRTEFSHAKRKTMVDTNFTDVTTLVQQEEDEDDGTGLQKPKKVKIRDESMCLPPPVSMQRDEGKRKKQQNRQEYSEHSTQGSGNTGVSMNSTMTTATHESQEINLQNNIIVDGSNRSWLEEGFEGDGLRMLKSYL